MRFDLISVFPRMFDSYLKESILARAQKKRLVKIVAHNLRTYAIDKHKTVDDAPYGGGAGMVLKIEPIWRCVQFLRSKIKNKKSKVSKPLATGCRSKVILLSAKGRQFTQAMAQQYAKLDHIIFICGRYEGVDERVASHVADEEISIGPYVLTGGELPAMVLIDAISRHIPGVLGNKNSLLEESFSNSSLNPKRHTQNVIISGRIPRRSAVGMNASPERSGGDNPDGSPISGRVFLPLEEYPAALLRASVIREYPHYTRPAAFKPKKGIYWRVPKVLLSGDHGKINAWRAKSFKKKKRGGLYYWNREG